MLKQKSSWSCLAPYRQLLPMVMLGVGVLYAGPNDTDWIVLFNGNDFSGLYTYNYNDGKNTYDSSLTGTALFKPAEGQIKVNSGGGQRGHIASKREFSFFHMKVDWNIPNGNCGVMYHVREDLALQNPKVRLYDVFPPSIECQGQKGQGGDCWAISNVWIDTKTKNGKWDETGNAITFGGVSEGGRMVSASEHRDKYGADNPTGWNTEEVIAYGNISVTHIVNGGVVFKGSNLLYTPGNAPTTSGAPKAPFEKIPFDHGHLALQAEQVPVSYRTWKVADLAGCKDESASNYKSYLQKNVPGDCQIPLGLPNAPRVKTKPFVSLTALSGSNWLTGVTTRDALGRDVLNWRTGWRKTRIVPLVSGTTPTSQRKTPDSQRQP